METEKDIKNEQMMQQFKSLDLSETSSLYFGLIQMKQSVELISDMMYAFPNQHVEDAWTVARDRIERFISSFFHNGVCEDEFNIQAIDAAADHLKNVWSRGNKKDVILKLLREIRT